MLGLQGGLQGGRQVGLQGGHQGVLQGIFRRMQEELVCVRNGQGGFQLKFKLKSQSKFKRP